AQFYLYRLDGVLVQSSLSQVDRAYAVYDGNTQRLALTSAQALTINGDQLASADDSITIRIVNEGYTIDLNEEIFSFDSGGVSSITLNPLTGNDTVNLEATFPDQPVTVNLGNGDDTVNLSVLARELRKFGGNVTVNGGSGSATLNLFDQASNDDRSYA